jgi:hypothetical protein
MDDKKALTKLREQEIKTRQVLIELAEKRRELMTRLESSGVSFVEIGKIYGVSKQRVEAIVKNRKKA